jgi:hypothetical protein
MFSGKLFFVALVVACAAVFMAAPAATQPGTLIGNVPLPVTGYGVSVAVDCFGNVYYTLYMNSNLYKMDKTGALLATIPIVDTTTGQALYIDEMAFQNTGGAGTLWGQVHSSNPIDVYRIDPASGAATFAFTSATVSIGTFRDGIAFDGTDNTLWITGDVSDTIEHYQLDGTFINAITPKNAAGGTLGLISGITVGVGDLLYLGRNGAVEIVQVKKSNGDFIASFASPGGARDEGLECDPVNFAPKLALWSRDFDAPGFMSVIEVEAGTCACGGGPGTTTVAFDIKPTSCPNPFNTKPFENMPNDSKSKKGGVLPVAILGTANFDVTQIDVSTVRLEGLEPLRYDYEDASAPVVDGEECECTTAGPDGYVDLTLKFQASDVAAILGLVNDGDVIPLVISGLLTDGTAFEGTDCIRILSKDLQPPVPLVPEGAVLGPAVPNPFNPTTRISFFLPKEDHVRLYVYDVSGKLIEELVSGVRPAGEHVVEWNATRVASGVYFYRLVTGESQLTRKMLLMK